MPGAGTTFQIKSEQNHRKDRDYCGPHNIYDHGYILFLNPNILSATGMDKNAVFFATAVAAGVVTIAMGLFVNFPIALAPGMGLNAFFAAVAVQGVGIPWQVALVQYLFPV
ncbi:hypothetical protein N752_07605 [Desulforamulus aquiferis]|nr:hypothetical protein [Desulforamulus aquiferis]RYD05751.1 hypothetical protein N752_07605 [Desulforamulus aquiferis]